MGVQARITLAVGVAVALMLAGFGYSATWAVRESTATVLQDRVQIAEVLAGQIATALSGNRYALEALARTLSQNPELAQQQRVLRRAAKSRQFAGLALTTRAGAILEAYPADWLTFATFGRSAGLGPDRSGRTVGPHPLTTLTGSHLAAFTVPLPGSDRLLLGAVDLAAAARADALRTQGGAPLSVEIIDAGGMVLETTERNEIGRPTEHLPVIAALIRQNRVGIAFHHLPGNPHYVAYAPLPGYPGLGVDVEHPRDLVLSLPSGLERRMAFLGAAIAAGVLLLVFLEQQLRKRVRQLGRLYEDVRAQDGLRRQLMKRLVTAQEEERRRITRELHDEIAQALTALVLQLGRTAGTLPPDATVLRDRLTEIRELTSATIGNVRRLMLNLRPAVLDDLGLVPAIRWYADAHLRPAGIDAQVLVAGMNDDRRLPGEHELVAFRLTQEALSNVLRHAGATQVTVSLERANGTLSLAIKDNGRGFDVDAHRTLGPAGGWGLAGMRERAALAGGSMTVSSQPGHGTRVAVAIPVAEHGDGR